MVDHFVESCGADQQCIMARYDNRTEDALVALVGSLPPDAGLELLDHIQEAAAASDLAWSDILQGSDGGSPSYGTRPGRGRSRLTPNDGDNDAEHPSATPHGGTMSIQRRITSQIDKTIHTSS